MVNGFTCSACHGYAPPNGQGQPLWGSRRQPLCTRCACARFARQTGCDPKQAEHLLYQRRGEGQRKRQPG